MTRTAGAPIGCQRPSRFWGLGCPKIYHEAEDTLGLNLVCIVARIALMVVCTPYSGGKRPSSASLWRNKVKNSLNKTARWSALVMAMGVMGLISAQSQAAINWPGGTVKSR
ncbi:hypothetical protein [Thiolapillus sp.]|uniref:hypothetical protein n=1 Tax=Thiolapillus sp. TaxID=2017437 RepID=UPI003AF95377